MGYAPCFSHLSRLRGRSTRSAERGGWGHLSASVFASAPHPGPPPQAGEGDAKRSGRDARGFFDDRKAHAGLVAVFFRNLAPALFGLFTGLERAFDLGRAFHELVEVHRAELAANHPEIAALCHDSLLAYSPPSTFIPKSSSSHFPASFAPCNSLVS